MLIQFNKITLNNFASFKHTTIPLTNAGYTLIQGRNKCVLDNALSNGSGKSSIFNALCFVLTGETTQGSTQGFENILSNPDNCWVEVEFLADNDLFIIRRYKTPKPDMKIFINGIDRSGKGIRESVKLLNQYLPDLTAEIINSIIILGQGLPSRFSNNAPARRKEILELLTKSDFMIQQIKDKLEARQTDLKVQLRSQEDQKLSSDTKLSVYQQQLDSVKTRLADIQQNKNINIADTKQKLENVKVQITEENKRQNTLLEEIKTCSDKLNKSLLASDSQLKAKIAPIEATMQQQKDELSQTSACIKSLQKELTKLHSITTVCPTCGQTIPGAIKPNTHEQEEELAVLSTNAEQLNNLIHNLEAEISNITSEVLKDREAAANIIKAEQQEKSYKLAESKTKLDKLIIDNNSLTHLLAEATSNAEAEAKLLADILDIELKIAEVASQSTAELANIVNTQAHLQVLQQLITLAKREFRGVLLQSVIHAINNKVKIYSTEVFGNTALSFELNENCIDIIYCGKLYENLSGGEKQKIDIIIQLALRDILSKQLNLKTNLLVCDEVLDNIDSIGAEKIINIIQGQGDIDSIFFITHHQDLLNMSYDNIITIEKNEEGISKVV